MNLLIKKEQESFVQNVVMFAKKSLKINMLKIKKKNKKIRDHYYYAGKYRGATHSICNLKYVIPKEITTDFHNGSNYNYHFIIKVLGKKSEEQLTCLGKNSEK